MDNEKTTTTEEETETETQPEPVKDMSAIRRALSETGKREKAALAELAEYKKAEQDRAEANKLANNGHLEVIEELKREKEALVKEKAESDRAARTAKLDSELMRNGAHHEPDRFWLAAKYDGESDIAEFTKSLLGEYADMFAPDKTPARSAGSHGSVSTSTKTGHEEIIKLAQSKNNLDVNKAYAMAAAIEKSGKPLSDDVRAALDL